MTSRSFRSANVNVDCEEEPEIFDTKDLMAKSSKSRPFAFEFMQKSNKLDIEAFISLMEAGGIESIMVCFAEIIRRSWKAADKEHCDKDNPEAIRMTDEAIVETSQYQSQAFSILLRMAQTNQHHMTKFLDELNGLKLVEFILVHPYCSISKDMLDCYWNFCLMSHTPSSSRNRFDLIKSPKLLFHLLYCWRAWHRDFEVAESLYRRLIRLLQPVDSYDMALGSRASNLQQQVPGEKNLESDHINHNLRMLTQAGGIDILMGILRECLVPLDESTVRINHELVELIINLISLLIRHPPGLDVMLDIMEFLLFLHPDPKSYVEVLTDKTSFLHVLQRPAQRDSEIESNRREKEHSNQPHSTPDSTTSSSSSSNASFNGSNSKSSNNHSKKYQEDYKVNTSAAEKSDGDLISSSRNYAIAGIADMLASILKLSLTDSLRILPEALEKSIIDARKIIILANNNSSRVREKVLRLFLCCIRACYTLNLKNVLYRYEQVHQQDQQQQRDPNGAGSNFKTCLPVQLMARQLLKYPTTIKMIQLCYGVILGIDDFEMIETVCLKFDIETIDSNLHLNTLILLIQLMTQLEDPIDIISTVRFVRAYVKQLMQLGEDEILSFLIKNILIDNLMQLYFSLVKNEVQSESPSGLVIDEHEEYNENKMKDTEKKDFGDVLRELDCMLLLMIKYLIEYLPTNESVRSIDQLLAYLSLMNTYVPKNYQRILRDRKVKILSTSLAYCKHYERCARQHSCSGLMVYYLKSFFRNNQFNTFPNYLSNSQLEELSSAPKSGCTGETNELSIEAEETKLSDELDDKSSDSFSSDSTDRLTSEDEIEDGLSQKRRRSISENSVLQRFKASLKFSVNFITTREPGVIPSPYEREFIMECVRTLYHYLSQLNQLSTGKLHGSEQKCHWFLMLPRLERIMRDRFSQLILYLLSPCDSMNLDERKYYASKLLSSLDVEQLINLLSDKSGGSKTTLKVLLLFLKEIAEYSNSPQEKSLSSELGDENETAKVRPSELDAVDLLLEEDEQDIESDVGEEDDDIEVKLKLLISKIELKLGMKHNQARSPFETETKVSPEVYLKKARLTMDRVSANNQLDCKYRDIWLANLEQTREEARERLLALKGNLNMVRLNHLGAKITTSVESLIAVEESLSPSTAASLSTSDRLVEEALTITRDVVKDKHEQRKIYLEDLKQMKVYNYHTRQQWLSLIIGHTHERAVWFMPSHYPKSWELNPVEGPSRIRRRLRPCKLMLESRYFRSNFEKEDDQHKLNQSLVYQQESEESSAGDWYNSYSPHPLCSMVLNNEQTLDSNKLRIRMFTTDRIHFNCDCSIIRPNEVCDGEILIADWCIHFIGERKDSIQQEQQQQQNQQSTMRFVENQSETVTGIVDESGYGSHHRADSSATTTTTSMATFPSYSSPALNSNEADDRTTTRTTITPTSMTSRLHVSSKIAKKVPPSFNSTIVEDLWFDEIVEVWNRRYQLQDVGLEIFLTNNVTYLISFRTNRDREDFKQNLMREQNKMINLHKFNLNTSLNRITQLWRDGRLTNFDFLTCLNKWAGRSFNDLMQYPVFPFILSNYTSNELDLTLASNFRNLKKPMAIQNQEKESTFINNYQDSQSNTLSAGFSSLQKPYHYGNHYSNSATVLHFLVRLPPFTQMLIQYQDNNFDQPDRTFHSIASTWQLITRDSNTDFKELIPEFFFLPEMFLNLEQFDLGRKQNNELVDDVKMPAWCPQSNARLFTLIHRQALESAHVSENLHHWIDLIFGYKQTGKAAVEALNVFHPATYYGMIDLNADSLQLNQPANPNRLARASNLSKLSSKFSSSSTNQTSGDTALYTEDVNDKKTHQWNDAKDHYKSQQGDIERLALETMIKTYGQMPRQLFTQPMKQRSFTTFASSLHQPPTVITSDNASDSDPQLATSSSGSSLARGASNQRPRRRLEPLRQVKGLKWGSYVGSPDESDIIAVKHKEIPPEEPNGDLEAAPSLRRHATFNRFSSNKGSAQLINWSNAYAVRRQAIRFNLCLMPNGDIAILRSNTSLMLDYRDDRKSGGGYQLSLPSARYSRRAGLSSVARMNLFSNMIISRQQFSSMEPAHFSTGGPLDSNNTSAASITTPSRIRFSPESLSLVSWAYQDGFIRIRQPAFNNQQPTMPLLKANSTIDTMTTCASVPELNLLLVGYKSGAICAHIVSSCHKNAPTYNSLLSNPNFAAATSTLNLQNKPAGLAHEAGAQTDNVATSGLSKMASSSSLSSSSIYSPLSFISKTQHSTRSVNKASRWLYCHSRQINCMKINVSFGIVVTGSDDGTSVIWDLNSLTYVRTIDYKLKTSSIRRRPEASMGQQQRRLFDRCNGDSYTYDDLLSNQQRLFDYLCTCDERDVENENTTSESLAVFPHALYRTRLSNGHDDELSGSSNKRKRRSSTKERCMCASGVNLIAISDTLGDIVTVKNINNRMARASKSYNDEPSDIESQSHETSKADHSGVERPLLTSEPNDENLNEEGSAFEESDESYLSSVIYVHTINGSLVGFINCHSQVTAVCYSNAPEGISVNVIVVGLADGLIRMYSSWNCTRVKEFHVSGFGQPITSLLYSRDNQLLYVVYVDGQFVVLRNKKRNSVTMRREWFL